MRIQTFTMSNDMVDTDQRHAVPLQQAPSYLLIGVEPRLHISLLQWCKSISHKCRKQALQPL